LAILLYSFWGKLVWRVQVAFLLFELLFGLLTDKKKYEIYLAFWDSPACGDILVLLMM